MKNMIILVLCLILGVAGGIFMRNCVSTGCCSEDGVCCCDENTTGSTPSMTEEAKKKCAKHCKCDKCKDGCHCKKDGKKCCDACKCAKK